MKPFGLSSPRSPHPFCCNFICTWITTVSVPEIQVYNTIKMMRGSSYRVGHHGGICGLERNPFPSEVLYFLW